VLECNIQQGISKGEKKAKADVAGQRNLEERRQAV